MNRHRLNAYDDQAREAVLLVLTAATGSCDIDVAPAIR